MIKIPNFKDQRLTFALVVIILILNLIAAFGHVKIDSDIQVMTAYAQNSCADHPFSTALESPNH